MFSFSELMNQKLGSDFLTIRQVVYNLFNNNEIFEPIYFTLFYGIFIFILIYSAMSLKNNKLNKVLEKYNAFVLLFFIFWGQMPTIAYGPTAIDESELLISAQQFLAKPYFWLSVDPNTMGPLDILILLLPCIFGATIDYGMMHLVSLFLILSFVYVFYKTSRLFLNHQWSLIVSLPVIFGLAFMSETDYVHYSSEKLPILLLSLQIYYSCKYLLQKKLKHALIAILISSTLPFAKLQATLIAACIDLYLVYKLIYIEKNIRKTSILILTSGLIIPGMVFTYIYFTAAWDDFMKSYVFNNLFYAVSSNWADRLKYFKGLTSQNAFMSIRLLTFLIIFYLLYKSIKTKKELYVYSLILSSSCYFAIIQPGTNFYHYDFLLLPACFMGLITLIQGLNKKRIIYGYLIISVAIIGITKTGGGFRLNIGRLNHFSSVLSDRYSKKMLVLLEPDEVISIFGWRPDLYLLTGTLPVHRSSHSDYIFRRSYDLKYYRKRFLNELKHKKPRLIFEAFGKKNFGFYHETKESILNIESFAKYVKKYYKPPIIFAEGLRMFKKIE